MVIGKAALPLLAGAASLALRAGWKVLQQRLLAAATQPPTVEATMNQAPLSRSQPPTIQPRPPVPPARPRRTVHIRSSWAVGDGNGNWRRGSSEHTIEFED